MQVNSRNQSLDVLRGVAILLVLGCHLNHYPLWKQAGWIGVDLFFVLSGFLISGLLFHEYKASGNIDVGRFFLRRGLKIWPAFYVFVLVVGAVAIYHGFPLKMFAVFVVELSLFLQNYVGGGAGIISHVWSLCVEEHFYLALPLVLLGLSRWKNEFKAIPWILFVLMPLCLSLRVLKGLPAGQVFCETHLRIDSLFFGVTLGYLFHFRPTTFAKLSNDRWLGLVALCCLPAFIFAERTRIMQGPGISLLAIGFFFLTAWALPRKPHKAFVPIAHVGRYSYSIYIWHMPIALLIRGDSFLSFWAAIVVCITTGIIMAKLVEMPVLRLRDRFFPASQMTTRLGSASDRIPVPEVVNGDCPSIV